MDPYKLKLHHRFLDQCKETILIIAALEVGETRILICCALGVVVPCYYLTN